MKRTTRDGDSERVTIGFMLKREHIQKLKQLARQERRTLANLVRVLVEDGLARPRATEKEDR